MDGEEKRGIFKARESSARAKAGFVSLLARGCSLLRRGNKTVRCDSISQRLTLFCNVFGGRQLIRWICAEHLRPLTTSRRNGTRLTSVVGSIANLPELFRCESAS